jgi:hypothetical protein
LIGESEGRNACPQRSVERRCTQPRESVGDVFDVVQQCAGRFDERQGERHGALDETQCVVIGEHGVEFVKETFKLVGDARIIALVVGA